ncbi:MAG: accessory factor UbiK family protein [Rhodospirillales bacterium]|nr:MAG: accessory factor UbiK family protein [Rhodospirillales bacterium]
MQVDNRLLDDLARLAGGAAGALSGVRGEVEARLKEQFERILAEMDVVSREEFEAVKAIAAKARTEQERLERRVAALEAALAGRPAAPKSTRSRSSKAKSPESGGSAARKSAD